LNPARSYGSKMPGRAQELYTASTSEMSSRPGVPQKTDPPVSSRTALQKNGIGIARKFVAGRMRARLARKVSPRYMLRARVPFRRNFMKFGRK
jgi:hypothetical protein